MSKRLENELGYREHNEGSLSVIEEKLEFVLQKVEESHSNFLIRDGRVVSVITNTARTIMLVL